MPLYGHLCQNTTLERGEQVEGCVAGGRRGGSMDGGGAPVSRREGEPAGGETEHMR